jgi:hypothetical protein
MIPAESPGKLPSKARVSARSDVFLRNERRDIERDSELFSLIRHAFQSLLNVNACFLQLIHGQGHSNSDTSISTYFEPHALASSGAINFISKMDRDGKVLLRLPH